MPSGYSKLGMTNTELGDRVEAAIANLPGWKALVGKSAGTVRQGAFDLESPEGLWCEVKAVAWDGEHKVKSKAAEIIRKMDAAEQAGRDPATIIAVVHPSGLTEVWLRVGLGCFRLPRGRQGWTLVGEVIV